MSIAVFDPEARALAEVARAMDSQHLIPPPLPLLGGRYEWQPAARLITDPATALRAQIAPETRVSEQHAALYLLAEAAVASVGGIEALRERSKPLDPYAIQCVMARIGEAPREVLAKVLQGNPERSPTRAAALVAMSTDPQAALLIKPADEAIYREGLAALVALKGRGGDIDAAMFDLVRARADCLTANGYKVLPLHNFHVVDKQGRPRGKSPVGGGWNRMDNNLIETNLRPGANLGILAGRYDERGVDLAFIDNDTDDAGLSKLLFDAMLIPNLGVENGYRVGKPGRWTIPVLIEDADDFRDGPKTLELHWTGEDGRKIDIQVLLRTQSAVDGIHPDTLKPWEWIGPGVFERAIEKLPRIRLNDQIDALSKAAGPGFRRVAVAAGERKKQARRVRDLKSLAAAGKTPVESWCPDLSPEEGDTLAPGARRLIAEMTEKLKGKVAGQKRGTDVHHCARDVAPLVLAGVVTREEIIAGIAAAEVPLSDVEGDFIHGLENRDVASKSWAHRELIVLRQFALHTTRLKREFTEPFDVTSPRDGDTRTGKDIARAAFDYSRHQEIVLLPTHGDMMPVARAAASAFATANDGLFFRARQEIVHFAPTATPPKFDGNSDDLAKFIASNRMEVVEKALSEDELIMRFNGCVSFYRPTEIPTPGEHQDVAYYRCDGDKKEEFRIEELAAVVKQCDMISWIVTPVSKAGPALTMPEFFAKTARWAAANAHNPETLEQFNPNETAWTLTNKVRREIINTAFAYAKAAVLGAWVWGSSGVVAAPTMGPGGVLWMREGYNWAADGHGVFTAMGELGEHLRIPDLNDFGALMSAIARLKDFTDLFPYGDEPSRGVVLALPYSLLARRGFMNCPAFLADAPHYGTGKSFMGEVNAAICGTGFTLLACASGGRKVGDESEELRKRFEGQVMEGASGLLMLDDVPHRRMPNFETLRAFIANKTGSVDVRRLGDSKPVSVRSDRLVIMATGNNTFVAQDMVRRTIRARLDRHAAKARGWSVEDAADGLHAFMTDPIKRGQLLSDVLFILAWNHKHRPCKIDKRLDNFEDWSRLVREAVILTLGEAADPIVTQEALRSEDPVADGQYRTCAALKTLFVEDQFTTRDAADKVYGSGISIAFAAPTTEADKERADAIATLHELFEGVNKQQFTRRLGYSLRNQVDAPLGTEPALVVRRSDPKSKSKQDLPRWRIEVLK